MIVKIDENLGWNEKENNYTGKPSSVNFDILIHNKKNLYFFL